MNGTTQEKSIREWTCDRLEVSLVGVRAGVRTVQDRRHDSSVVFDVCIKLLFLGVNLGFSLLDHPFWGFTLDGIRKLLPLSACHSSFGCCRERRPFDLRPTSSTILANHFTSVCFTSPWLLLKSILETWNGRTIM